MCGTRSLPPEPSWTPSSCKPGASCVDHTQDGLQQQVSNSPAASSGEPGLSNWHSTPPAVVSAASPAAGARHRRRNQHLDGRRVLSAATDAPQGQGVPCHQPPGTRSAPAPATARPPPGSTLTQLAAAPYRPTSITGGSAERHAPHQQQLLPALVASCAQEGWRELPPGCWYTPVTQLVPVNMKVSACEPHRSTLNRSLCQLVMHAHAHAHIYMHPLCMLPVDACHRCNQCKTECPLHIISRVLPLV